MSSRKTIPRLARAVLAMTALLVVAGQTWAGTVVAIVKGKDVDRMVAEAIELLGGMEQFVKDGQKVVIKPNVVHQPDVTGYGRSKRDKKMRLEYTTDVRIVKALAQQMTRTARCTITVAEGTPEDLSELFKHLGYTEAAAELGFKLVDVDKSKRMTVKVDGLARKEYSMPVVTQTSDVLVDVAAMKTHQLTGVTLGMKNFFGLLPMPKSVFHGKINEVLCDLCLMRKPDLAIVDGLVAMEGQGPLQGTPVAMDLLVAGRDIVAVDAVCTAIMGFDPNRVKHLKLANETGIGEIDLKKITIKGVPIEKVRRRFKHARWEAEVRIDKTDEAVGRLALLADHIYKDWRRGSVFMSFSDRHLRVDSSKYPTRESRGFHVRVPRRRGQISFSIPYKILFDENGQAAVDEVERWVWENLGKETKVVKHPFKEPE